MARGKPVIRCSTVAKLAPLSRVTIPELTSPLSMEGLECATHRSTLLAVASGETVIPRVSLGPTLLISDSIT